MEKLTSRQQVVLDFIRDFTRQNGSPPTFADIASGLDRVWATRSVAIAQEPASPGPRKHEEVECERGERGERGEAVPGGAEAGGDEGAAGAVQDGGGGIRPERADHPPGDRGSH